MSPPDVSICMATRNHAMYIEDALESLRRQTLDSVRFEVIVIDDGSTDETRNILLNWVPWIRMVSRENRGLVPSCNEGLALSRGRYFARLDSDDLVDSSWLESMVAALDARPHACLAFPDRLVMERQSTRRVSASADNVYSLEACGTLFRADTLRHAGGFRAFYWEEYDLYARLRSMGEWTHVPLPLYVYRKHESSMTSRAADRLDGWRQLAGEWGADTLRSLGSSGELDQALAVLEREAVK